MSRCWRRKYLPLRPATVRVTTSISATHTSTSAVRGMLLYTMPQNTASMVTAELIIWGRDWETICRRVSTSLV